MAQMWLVDFSKLSHDLGTCTHRFSVKCVFQKRKLCRTSRKLSSLAMKPAFWSIHLSQSVRFQRHALECRYYPFSCNSFLTPSQPPDIPYIKSVASTLARSYNGLDVRSTVFKLIPAVGTITFCVLGVGPLLRLGRNVFIHKSNSNWDKSGTYFFMTSYLQPFLLWTGAMLLCRALDPMMLPTEASQIIKQHLLYFVRSLSTVLALAYCLSCVIQQVQKLFMDTISPSDTRNVGFQCAGTALYAAVWVAAVLLFIELLGFSTKKLLTVGGLGTVLLTLACREVLTNFISSVMIHVTRPFVVNDVIRTTIKGTEVSGAVEHVGWWSPTIIRGEYGEAVYVPNHQFTAKIVRNLSHKSHWRIKTYLAISHLDFRKIKNIVADMRKVLAKNPQVEQKKLHRRVFLDNINPDNQALTILVSCFVKTSRTEEYLCVKEAILMDLLGVIRHHQARLATPIRTVQRVSDTELHNIPHVHPAGPTKLDHRDIFLNRDFKTTKQSNSHSKSPDIDNVTRNRKGKSKNSSDAEQKGIYWPSIL